MPSSDPVKNAFRRIYELAVRIPRGRVLTYGELAQLAGMPRGARVAGYAMRASGSARLRRPIPWQRVVGKRREGVGQVSIKDPVGGAMQRQLLEAEGVEVSASGAIDLSRFGAWTHFTGGSPARKNRPGKAPGRSRTTRKRTRTRARR